MQPATRSESDPSIAFRDKPGVLAQDLLLQSPQQISVFEHLLNVASFPLKLPGDLLAFTTRFDVLIVRHFAKAFFRAALHFPHFPFCLIDRAIFHTENYPRNRPASMGPSPDLLDRMSPSPRTIAPDRGVLFSLGGPTLWLDAAFAAVRGLVLRAGILQRALGLPSIDPPAWRQRAFRAGRSLSRCDSGRRRGLQKPARIERNARASRYRLSSSRDPRGRRSWRESVSYKDEQPRAIYRSGHQALVPSRENSTEPRAGINWKKETVIGPSEPKETPRRRYRA